MNVLVLNGSPKGVGSNTYRITDAFLSGIKAELGEDVTVDTVLVSAAHIGHCRGCFGCWTATPGNCVIHDDMEEILPKILEADVLVWSFPVYYFGMPSKIKALLDRTLPMFLPYLRERPDGGIIHPTRQPVKEDGRTSGSGFPGSTVLISTGGLGMLKNNYEALLKQFDILCGGSYERILCPQGAALPFVGAEEYLSCAREAGREYARNGRIQAETARKLDTPLYSYEQYTQMADASWDMKSDTENLTEAEKERSAAERFTRQMAATYHPESFDGTERVFEIYYTDVKIGYQLVMGKGRCEVRAENAGPYTTRVETPLTVWQDISKGIYSGEQAMMEGKYRTLGDLKLLISWGRYFGSNHDSGSETKTGDAGTGSAGTEKAGKKTNMTILIMPWFVIWVLLTINPVIGGIAGVCASACIHFANLKWNLTVYDYSSCLCVSVFSLLALLDFDMQIVVPLAYLSFGVMWLLSCFTHIPLTAHYSKENYNGDDALKNPLFMRTNRILTICWGVLYLITPIWTYFIMGSSAPYLTALVNTICPALLGVFTGWFQKWYPAKIARG